MTSVEFTHKIAGLRSTLQMFTRRFTRDREESHDLVQDTMLKALLYREKFRDETNLNGWLFTIMRNTFINNYRRTKRSQTKVDMTKDLYFLNVAEEHTFNRPQERMQFQEIWQNIHAIKEDLLMPFKLYTTGYHYHEIAERLKIPIGTVKNRIFQARKEIQKRLPGY